MGNRPPLEGEIEVPFISRERKRFKLAMLNTSNRPYSITPEQSFLLTIPHPREACSGEGGVTIEVYDEDFGNPSDFLGQVNLPSVLNHIPRECKRCLKYFIQLPCGFSLLFVS